MSDFIHQYLPGAPENPRVFLLLHGTGGNESDLLPLGRELDPTAALLSPRGQVLENGMPRFFRRFAEGVFDEADVIQRANELADFIAESAKRHNFATENLIAVGYSNGANIAAAMMLLRPQLLPAAILFRAMIVLSNPPAADLHGRRIFLSAGNQDPIIQVENVQQLAATLADRGADVTLKIQQAGHGLVREDLAAAKSWLDSG